MFRRLARILLLIFGAWLGVMAALNTIAELDRQDRAVTVTAWSVDDEAAAKIRRQNEAFDLDKPVVRLHPPVDGHAYAALELGFVQAEDLGQRIEVQFDPDAPDTVVVDDPAAYWFLPLSFGVPAIVLLFVALVFLRPRSRMAPPPLRRVDRVQRPLPPAGRATAKAAAGAAEMPPATPVAVRSVIEHVSRRDSSARTVIQGPIVDRTVRRPTTLAPIFAVLVLLAGVGAILYVTMAPAGP